MSLTQSDIIQSLELADFVYQGYTWQLKKAFYQDRQQNNTHNVRYREGSYVYFVDFAKQLVLAHKNELYYPQIYSPLGGGIENEETPIQALAREVREESGILLDTSLAHKFVDLYIHEEFEYAGEKYQGKQLHFYITPTDADTIEQFYLLDSDTPTPYAWHTLSDLCATDRFLHYSLWREFCLTHHLPPIAITPEIQKQYLAHLLDQNHITRFTEFGSRSQCILKYQKPETQLLKSPTISLSQSLDNVQEIWLVIQTLYPTFEQMQRDLYNSIFTSDIHTNFQTLSSLWEIEINTWLIANQQNKEDYLLPLQIALAGVTNSPTIYDILSILSHDEAQERINNYLSQRVKSIISPATNGGFILSYSNSTEFQK